MTDEVKVSKEEFGTMAIAAIRYCHGRRTYMPKMVQAIVEEHVKELSSKDLRVMIDDCEFQERLDLYGDLVIDKPGWLKYKDALQAEMKRRQYGVQE